MSFLPLLFSPPFDSLPPDTMIPTGSILAFAGSAAPSGYVFCYGQSLDRTANAALFAAIGVAYGSLDANSFSVPDLRGRVAAGKDDMGGVAADRLTISTVQGVDGLLLGNSGGEQGHICDINEMPAHAHSYANGNASFDAGTTYIVAVNGVGGAITESVGLSATHNNVQPTLIVNHIIKL